MKKSERKSNTMKRRESDAFTSGKNEIRRNTEPRPLLSNYCIIVYCGTKLDGDVRDVITRRTFAYKKAGWHPPLLSFSVLSHRLSRFSFRATCHQSSSLYFSVSCSLGFAKKRTRFCQDRTKKRQTRTRNEEQGFMNLPSDGFES